VLTSGRGNVGWLVEWAHLPLTVKKRRTVPAAREKILWLFLKYSHMDENIVIGIALP